MQSRQNRRGRAGQDPAQPFLDLAGLAEVMALGWDAGSIWDEAGIARRLRRIGRRDVVYIADAPRGGAK